MYTATDFDDVKDLFKVYVKDKKFMDLGCGDGRVMNYAVLCGAKSVTGIEVNQLIKPLNSMKRKIIYGDIFDTPIGDAEVIFYYVGSTNDYVILEKLSKEFKGILIAYWKDVVDDVYNNWYQWAPIQYIANDVQHWVVYKYV